MEDVEKIHGHLVYFIAIGYICWLFGIFVGYWVYFSRFGILHQEKSGNPDLHLCGFCSLLPEFFLPKRRLVKSTLGDETRHPNEQVTEPGS
jgi:hypothetical protein